MSKQKTPDTTGYPDDSPADNVAPPAEKTVMKVSDPEAQAIAKMGAIMTGLDAGGRRRALAWVNDRFQEYPMKAIRPVQPGDIRTDPPKE